MLERTNRRARLRNFLAVILVALGTLAAGVLAYPAAPPDGKPEMFWSTAVPNPYAWLENVDSPRTRDWVAREQRLSRSYLDAIPERSAIKSAFRKLLTYERTEVPERYGAHWFFFRNSGLQNQSVLYVRDSERGPARVLLDPNRLSADGTVALGPEHSFTRDGRYFAYATQVAGSDWETWHIREVATGTDLPDRIRWSKFSFAVWIGDAGFYYSGYDPPAAGNTTLAKLGRQKVWYHRIGTPQSADPLIYGGDPAHPGIFANVLATEDEAYLFLFRTTISADSFMWKRTAQAGEPFRPLFDMMPSVTYDIVGNDGNRLYALTNAGAPLKRLVWVDVTDSRHVLHDIVAQRRDKLETVRLIGDRFYLDYLHDAHSRIDVVDRRGRGLGSIALPGIGSADVPTGRRTDRIAYYAFSSFTYPTTVYRYDTRTRRSTAFSRPAVAFDRNGFVTDLLFARSKDGTRVPVFVTHNKHMPYDGSTPTIVYGYGGFDVALTPQFDPGTILWLQMGGAYAQAVIRGGSEYGEAWHLAGSAMNKQHSFDDFIAASELLISRKISSPNKLAANGESNGGLLVGAVLTQRPDLYGATIPEVGVMDMLRYARWTVAKAWIPEYGSADRSRREFTVIRAFSPVENVKRGTRYPPTLVMTSDHDDRVYPAHSFKFTAELQAAQSGTGPILLRIESNGGHGFGRPTGKIIDDEADRYAFLVKSLHFMPHLGDATPSTR